MEPERWLGLVEALPIVEALRTSPGLYPLASGLHIVSLAGFFGALLTVDLAMVRLGRFPAGQRLAHAVAIISLVATLLTGALIFSVRPAEYVANDAFLLKLGLIAAGVVQASGFHLAMLSARPVPAGVVRTVGATSVALWCAVILAGRWIAFA